MVIPPFWSDLGLITISTSRPSAFKKRNKRSDELAYKYDIEVIKKYEGVMQLPVDEEKTALGEYCDKFTTPKLKPDVAYRIGRKIPI